MTIYELLAASFWQWLGIIILAQISKPLIKYEALVNKLYNVVESYVRDTIR